MDKDVVSLFAQIGAMKLLLGRAYPILYTLAKMSPDQVRQAHATLLANLPRQSLVATNDAAISDLLSAEIEAELRLLLRGIERSLEEMEPKSGPQNLS
jgi:hypothetical protein